MASPPYFRPRVKVTPAQDAFAASPDAVAGAGVATGAGVVAGSSLNPAGIRLLSEVSRPPGKATAVVVMISQKPNARHLFIFEPH